MFSFLKIKPQMAEVAEIRILFSTRGFLLAETQLGVLEKVSKDFL